MLALLRYNRLQTFRLLQLVPLDNQRPRQFQQERVNPAVMGSLRQAVGQLRLLLATTLRQRHLLHRVNWSLLSMQSPSTSGAAAEILPAWLPTTDTGIARARAPWELVRTQTAKRRLTVAAARARSIVATNPAVRVERASSSSARSLAAEAARATSSTATSSTPTTSGAGAGRAPSRAPSTWAGRRGTPCTNVTHPDTHWQASTAPNRREKGRAPVKDRHGRL